MWQVILEVFTIGWAEFWRTFFIALTKLEMILTGTSIGGQTRGHGRIVT
jgi:hypothetical protein